MLLSPTLFAPFWDVLESTNSASTVAKDLDHSSGPPPKVERLRYHEVDKASKSIRDAFHDDPMFLYQRDTPDAKVPGKLLEEVTRSVWKYNLVDAVSNGAASTVNHGDALAISTPAEADAPKKRPMHRFHDFLIKTIGEFLQKFVSPEQKRRQEEINDKLTKLIKDNVGAKAKEMMYLNLLATAPECQGQGYGSALLKVITDIADARGRSAYLISSNINNTAFYNSFGFVIVGSARLGEDNPTWQKDPVIVPLMVREGKDKNYDEKASLLV